MCPLKGSIASDRTLVIGVNSGYHMATLWVSIASMLGVCSKQPIFASYDNRYDALINMEMVDMIGDWDLNLLLEIRSD